MEWPPVFLKRLACQCAAQWPQLKAGGQGGPFREALAAGEAEGLGGPGGDGGSLSTRALQQWLQGLVLGPKPGRCVLIVNTDTVLMAPSRDERYGETGGLGGGLCPGAMVNLQRVLTLSGAELVISGQSRLAKPAREALAAALDR